MRPCYSWLLALAILGCGAVDVPGLEPSHLAAAFEFLKTQPPPALSDACDARHWIGVRAVGTQECPAPKRSSSQAAWFTSALFPGHAAPELALYCAYDWPDKAGAPDVEALHALLTTEQLDDLAQDCHVIAPAGPTAVDATWETLRESFRNQVDAVDMLPMGARAVPPVRVAVVDTSPEVYAAGGAVDGGTGHGFAVGRLIRELACPPDGWSVISVGTPNAGECIAQLSHHLALPLTGSLERDEVHGGSLGTFADLAKAVTRAVDAWLDAREAQPHLVVNLSLGWDGRYGGVLDADKPVLDAGPRAVYAAIARASCLGALVVAAAGNDSGGPEVRQGPLYPAGWETLPALDRTRCQSFVEAREQELLGAAAASKSPLLFAAGGVEGDDQALAIGRGGGRPRLAAPAAHAVADRFDAPTPAPTRILTGTSVAAAVTSAVAAVVWGYRPELTREAVVNALIASAVPLGQDADFCLGGLACPLPAGAAAREIRRLGLCPALRLACASGAGSCPPPVMLPGCKDRPAYADARATFSSSQLDVFLATSTLKVSAAAATVTLPAVSPCGPEVIQNDSASYPETTCPDRQLFTAVMAPWIGPQPGSAGCPACSVRVNGVGPDATLSLAIDADYPDALVTPTLRVDSALIVLPSVTLQAGDVVTFTDVPLPAGVSHATVSFTVEDPGTGTVLASTTNVLVVQ